MKDINSDHTKINDLLFFNKIFFIRYEIKYFSKKKAVYLLPNTNIAHCSRNQGTEIHHLASEDCSFLGK